MPEWVNKILKYNPGKKSFKKQFTIYLDLECTLKNYNLFKTTQKNLIQEKKARHEPSGWSMFTRCSFDKRENKIN